MATTLFCLEEGCKFARKDHKDSETIRCFMCMRWFHVKCVKETHPAALHACESCRSLATDVRSISSCLPAVMNKLDGLTEEMRNMKKSQDSLTKELKSLRSEYDATKSDNALLKKEILTLRAELHKLEWPLQPSDNAEKPTLVVGSSVLRDVDNDRLSNAYVHSMSGGKIRDAANYINDVPAGKYNNVVLLIGGNDCDDPSLSLSEITKSYSDLIVQSKTKFGQTIVGSVLPRRNPENPTVTERIDTLNAELQILSADNDCTFIDNNIAFKLQDGTINDGYYLAERDTGKLVHLNDRGTTKLCEILNIKAKNNKVTKDRFKNNPQSRHLNQRQVSQSNVIQEMPVVARENYTFKAQPRRPPTVAELPPAPQAFPRSTHPRPSPGPNAARTQRAPPVTVAERASPPPAVVPDRRPPARPVDAAPPRTWSYDRAPTYTSHRSADDFDTNFTRPYAHDNSTNQCYKCGEQHNSRSCWYGEPLTCRLCRADGHKEKDCPNRDYNYQSQHSYYSSPFVHESNFY